MIHYYDLTEPQKRIWYTQKIHRESCMYNIGGTYYINKAVDYVRLKKAVAGFITGRDAFSMRFAEVDGEPKYYYVKTPQPDIEIIDFSGNANPEQAAKSWIEEQTKCCFEIGETPLYQLAIFKLSENKCGYFAKIHHIIADGWSFVLIVKGIKKLYEQQADVEGDAVSYQEYASDEEKYLKSDKYNLDKAFWEDILVPLPEAAAAASPGYDGRRTTFTSKIDQQELEHFLHQESITMQTYLVGIYALYVYKTTNCRDFIIGCPILGRSGKREKELFGMCVQMLPVRIRLNPEMTGRQLLQHIAAGLKQSYRHMKYPYSHMVRNIAAGDIPLYTVCINYYNVGMPLEFDGASAYCEEFYNGQHEYDMQIVIRPWDTGHLRYDVDYKTSYMQEHQARVFYKLFALCEELLRKDLNSEIKHVQLLTQAEKLDRLSYNKTDVSFQNTTVLEEFERQVVKNPQKAALSFKEEIITYSELNKKTDKLANYLLNCANCPNKLVGLMADQSLSAIYSILGILKAGMAYLPIDPHSPIERISYIVNESGVTLLLTDGAAESRLPSEITCITVDEEFLNGIECDKPVDFFPDAKDLAYVIYTSGSTGRPKGVMIEHGSLANYIMWAKGEYNVLPDDVFPLYSSLSFDLTVTSVFVPLVSGATIRAYPERAYDQQFYQILAEDKCTIIKLTPSHLLLMKAQALPLKKLRKLIVGGEDLKDNLARGISEAYEKVLIYNEYGPTEATVGCMIYQFSKSDALPSVPIGKPAANCQIHILDKDYNPLPPGFDGEIYIAGKGLARGYINQPELTNQRFVNINGVRMYKTGDLAYFTEALAAVYKGRNDFYTKLNGYRISLDEIEHVISKYPAIEQTAVVLNNQDNESRLCAYYSAEAKVPEKKLREHMHCFVPYYMVPGVFIYMEKLPLTINGKIDKKYLSELPIRLINKAADSEEELNNVESTVVDVIREVIKSEDINLNTNFFHMGGDSIKAIQISSRLHNSGIKLLVKDIMANPILRDMCQCAGEIAAATYKEPVQGDIPIVGMSYWFFQQPFQRPDAYNQNILLELKRDFDKGQLEAVFQYLVQYHDMLRASVDLKNRKMYYNNTHSDGMSAIEEFEPGELNTPEAFSCFCDEMTDCLIAAIDMEESMFKVGMCRTKNKTLLCMVAHHLIIDGVSWQILLDDLFVLLKQILMDSPLKLPGKTTSYQEWANAQINKDQYCFKTSNGLSSEAPVYENETISINQADTDMLLKSINNAYNTGPTVIFIAVLGLVLKELKPDYETGVFIEGHGRGDIPNYSFDLSRTIGWFTEKRKWSAGFPDISMEKAILSAKEGYNNLFRSRTEVKEQLGFEEKSICLNYLGEVSGDYDLFKIVPVELKYFESEHSLDITAIIRQGELYITFQMKKNELEYLDIKKFADRFMTTLNTVYVHCLNCGCTSYSPSDFHDVELTQEEVDNLFY